LSASVEIHAREGTASVSFSIQRPHQESKNWRRRPRAGGGHFIIIEGGSQGWDRQSSRGTLRQSGSGDRPIRVGLGAKATQLPGARDRLVIVGGAAITPIAGPLDAHQVRPRKALAIGGRGGDRRHPNVGRNSGPVRSSNQTDCGTHSRPRGRRGKPLAAFSVRITCRGLRGRLHCTCQHGGQADLRACFSDCATRSACCRLEPSLPAAWAVNSASVAVDAR